MNDSHETESDASAETPRPSVADALHYPQARHQEMRIGEVLVDLGFTSEAAIEVAVGSAAVRGLLTGQALIEGGVVTGRQLALGLAACYGLPFLDYDEFPVDDRVLARVDAQVARKHMAIPCGTLEDGTMIVAISDYQMVAAVEKLSASSSRPVIFAVAQENDVYFMIKRSEALQTAAA